MADSIAQLRPLVTLLAACASMAACDGAAGDPPGGAEYEGVSDWCEPTFVWEDASRELEEEVLVRVNDYRADGANCGEFGDFPPASELVMQAQLRCAARMHSRAMALEDFFDHNSPNGDSMVDRMMKAGYSYFAAGENIASGQASAQEVVADWMGSDGHCRNIMAAEFSQIGIGYQAGLWTQVFGSPAQ